MMKILHTADWHLGKRLEQFPRLQEQAEVMNEICEIADQHDVDAVLIAGDLFDTFNPPTEAVDLFYKTLKRLAANGKRAVIAIAGNHDSPDRIEAPDPLARECGIFFAGYPHSQLASCELDSGLCILQSRPGFIEMKLPKHDFPLRLILTPYTNEYRLRTFLGNEDPEAAMRSVLQQHWLQIANECCDEQGVNMLMTHLYMMKEGGPMPEEPDDERPIRHVGGAQEVFSKNIPQNIQYVALGHLHRHQVVDNQPCPMVYSSSPLSYSFAEAGQTKYVVLVEAEPGKPVSMEKVALRGGKPLVRKRFGGIEDALGWLTENPETLVELTLVSDEYITGKDRKRLMQAHEGIVTIIPEIRNKELQESASAQIDLNQDIESLFISFFKDKFGQDPSEEILDLFTEVRAERSES